MTYNGKPCEVVASYTEITVVKQDGKTFCIPNKELKADKPAPKKKN